VRRVREAIAFRLARAQYLTDRGQFVEAIAMLERKVAARPRDADLYFALGAAHHMRGCLGDAVRVWTRGTEVQAELAREVGLSTNTRYLGTMFTRMIGHTAYFDTFAKRKILGLAPEKYVVLADRANIGNTAYVECWRAHFDVIDDSEMIRKMASTTRLLEAYPTVLLVDGNWRFIHDAAVEVESRWHDAGTGPLLTLKDEQRRRARRELEAMGLPSDCWFVCLHVREGVGASRRDGNIADYLPAIRSITQAGGWVVRIGDPSMTKMSDIPNLIDCAHKPRRDWLDVYALGAARFMIGTNSGPVFVAGTFGIPALLSNWAPIGIKSLYHNTITLPKRLWSQKHNRYLTAGEENGEPFSAAEWTQLLDQQQVRRADQPTAGGTPLTVQRHLADRKLFGLPLDSRRPRGAAGPIQRGGQMVPSGPRGRRGGPARELRDRLPQRLVQRVHVQRHLKCLAILHHERQLVGGAHGRGHRAGAL
jgi:putative glycosyltransferase (TIGR04372 family)